MQGIFISYRREDSEGQAGRLFDDLVAHFGRDAVFMDVANIKKGLDFRRSIEEQVAACGVLLVMIGKHWLGAAAADGRPRLADVNDFVRLETAAALARSIPVVPVLVQGAAMPLEQDLPDALKALAFRNGTELTHARWESDVKALIADLQPYVGKPVDPSGNGGEEPPKRKGWVIGLVVAIAVATGLFGVLRLNRSGGGGDVKVPPAQTSAGLPDSTGKAPVKASGPCRPGFEWRLATPDDHVCVLPKTHEQAMVDNLQAASRREGGGAFGPMTCKTGYVWREARPGDTVCVVPDVRSAALQDNALALGRGVYIVGPKP